MRECFSRNTFPKTKSRKNFYIFMTNGDDSSAIHYGNGAYL